MSHHSYRAALERRYDGPPPLSPSAWPDCDSPWQRQIRTRRKQAWRTVRQAARMVLSAKRDFRRNPSVESYRLWRLRRRALSHALAGWAAFRDLERSAQAGDRNRVADSVAISEPYNARPRSFP